MTKEIWPESENPAKFLALNHIIAVTLGELYVIGFTTAIKLVVDWTIEKKRNEKLVKLQIGTELNYLRTQIQPHFFFNSLNSLYALTLKKSDNAPRMILKLSDMMQYILYEVVNDTVSLLSEIHHINNFIEIHRLRFGERVDDTMMITGNIEEVKVPPLLITPFVENAFKHGLGHNNNLKISISFENKENDYLEFKVVNNFAINSNEEKPSGIGNINTKRRLSLLFPNNFMLESTQNKNNYKVFLKIPLS